MPYECVGITLTPRSAKLIPRVTMPICIPEAIAISLETAYIYRTQVGNQPRPYRYHGISPTTAPCFTMAQTVPQASGGGYCTLTSWTFSSKHSCSRTSALHSLTVRTAESLSLATPTASPRLACACFDRRLTYLPSAHGHHQQLLVSQTLRRCGELGVGCQAHRARPRFQPRA